MYSKLQGLGLVRPHKSYPDKKGIGANEADVDTRESTLKEPCPRKVEKEPRVGDVSSDISLDLWEENQALRDGKGNEMNDIGFLSFEKKKKANFLTDYFKKGLAAKNKSKEKGGHEDCRGNDGEKDFFELKKIHVKKLRRVRKPLLKLGLVKKVNGKGKVDPKGLSGAKKQQILEGARKGVEKKPGSILEYLKQKQREKEKKLEITAATKPKSPPPLKLESFDQVSPACDMFSIFRDPEDFTFTLNFPRNGYALQLNRVNSDTLAINNITREKDFLALESRRERKERAIAGSLSPRKLQAQVNKKEGDIIHGAPQVFESRKKLGVRPSTKSEKSRRMKVPQNSLTQDSSDSISQNPTIKTKKKFGKRPERGSAKHQSRRNTRLVPLHTNLGKRKYKKRRSADPKTGKKRRKRSQPCQPKANDLLKRRSSRVKNDSKNLREARKRTLEAKKKKKEISLNVSLNTLKTPEKLKTVPKKKFKPSKKDTVTRLGAELKHNDAYRSKFLELLTNEIQDSKKPSSIPLPKNLPKISKEERKRVKTPQRSERKKMVRMRPCKTKTDLLAQYEILEKIGEGTTSIVRKIRRKSDSKIFALKSYKTGKVWPKAVEEKLLLQQLDHPHVIKCYEYCKIKQTTHLILEFFDGITLSQRIKKKGNLSKNKTRFIARQLISTIRYCHSKGISHRDIKPENVMVDKYLNIKIIDFAFGIRQTYKKSEHKANCGTPNYMAPEVIYKRSYCPQPADIWAIGVLLLKIRSGKVPFSGKDRKELRKKIDSVDIDPRSTVNACDDLRDLIYKVFQKEAKMRPRAKDLLKHPFVVRSGTPGKTKKVLIPKASRGDASRGVV